MADLPPDFQIPTPKLRPRRPAVVTLAAGLLVVLGVFTLAFGAVLVGADEEVFVNGKHVGDAARSLGLASLAIGLLEVVTGVGLFRLKRAFRPVGIALSSVGALVAMGLLAGGDASQFLPILAHGFVITVLATSGAAFRQA